MSHNLQGPKMHRYFKAFISNSWNMSYDDVSPSFMLMLSLLLCYFLNVYADAFVTHFI